MKTTIAAVAFIGLISAGPALAESLKITNKASGIACYDVSDLMTAHGALGYYNIPKLQELILQDRCFIIPKHWQASLLDRQHIMGADVDMVKVRIYHSSESRFAWALKANFETVFGSE